MTQIEADDDLLDDLLAINEHGEALEPPGGICSQQIDFDALSNVQTESSFDTLNMSEWNRAADTYLLSSTSLGGVNAKDVLSLAFHRNAARLATG